MPTVTQIVEQLTMGTPLRRPNVRNLATQATLSNCGLATLGFALGVNFDRIVEGTSVEVPFGQSQFAFARGQQFERYLTKDSCKVLFSALSTDVGFDRSSTNMIDLRSMFPPNLAGMADRALKTKQVLADVIAGKPASPNLIVGAVFKTTIAGVDAFLEADAVAAHDSSGATIYTGEVKSFPIVDGRIDKDKLGKAADQVAVYQLLIQRAITEIGGDPSMVSDRALIITPQNTGFQPKISTLDVSGRVRRTEELLAAARPVNELVVGLPSNISFGKVADATTSEVSRLGALDRIATAAGTQLCSNCIAGCGLAHYCRRRAFEAGDPAVAGETVVRLTPGLKTFDDITRAARGSRIVGVAEPVVTGLRSAKDLYTQFIAPPTRKRGK
jgi:hypothetical protein